MSNWREREALWRYGLIQEALSVEITPARRGALVRALAARAHPHPSGTTRRVGGGASGGGLDSADGAGTRSVVIQPPQRTTRPTASSATLRVP